MHSSELVPEAVLLYREITELKKQFNSEKDPTKLWGLRRRIRKLQKMYEVCVSKEQHEEAVRWETFTNGF